jgi:hypothetical protein
VHIPIHSVSNLQVAPIEKGFQLENRYLMLFSSASFAKMIVVNKGSHSEAAFVFDLHLLSCVY